MEELTESVVLDEKERDRTVKIGVRLSEQVKMEIANLLKEYKGIFAWSHKDMPGISTSVISHYLAIDEKSKPMVQKRRSFNSERSATIREEVSKLLAAGSIREVKYLEWVANVILMKKKNNQWRMRVDFTDLNKACPKDSFSLSRIDQLVKPTAGRELLGFMDAYSGYNQIKMHKPDEDKTAFTTDHGLYCYTVMSFNLKNVGATYQRLVNRMFAIHIRRNIEVYVDDMLTKSVMVNRYVDDLRETFNMLTKFGMKLNLAKCVFSVPSGKFLGYQVHQRGIEVNLDKIQALADMVSSKTLKDIQKLTRCLASFNRLIEKSIDRCLPFFRALEKGKGVEWNKDCKLAFHALKEYLGRAPLLSKPVVGETLYIYLSVTEAATSYVLVRQEEGIQKPMYYTSKALLPTETMYSPTEKMTLALITVAGKLMPYFQAHKIEVYTNCPLKLILQKPEVSDRLTKWAIELSEFNIEYLLRTSVKGQAVAIFMAEYEALIAGLRVCTALGANEIEIFSDSQVVVNQVMDEYQTRDESMITYLELTKGLLGRFKEFKIVQIPKEKNEQIEVRVIVSGLDNYMTPIREYLINDTLPSDPLEAKRLKYKATRYSVLSGELYRRGFSRVLQRCVRFEEAEGILKDIHSRSCRNHIGGVSLAHKALRQGLYSPTLFTNAKRIAARCEACQKVANNIRQPPESLQNITSHWPFAIWAIDLIGPMPAAVGGAKHVIVVVDYFTKWVEAEPLVHITEANTTNFVKKNILYRFGIPNTIITDNGTQFDNKKFRELCKKYGINNYYASPAHPQKNG
ncbi:hypothetical protein Q3G72_020691 [Acer saccharum]|nr:hypothetical protein Q3G72_020691 [Acer saccharum]